MIFRWVEERLPGDRWRDLLKRTWPSYEAWFLREGDEARPGLEESAARLEQHMPELVPVWNRLVGLAGENERVARMLALYRPTPFLAGCSQAVWTRRSPMLVRNYDYDPSACEGTFLLSSWNGTRVLASSDCLWGALDGINEHGLAVALSFGGSPTVGDGFGIPLILRYILELCSTTEEAGDVLRRVPSHMAYNVSLVDRSGSYAVAHVGPGRATEIVRERVCTNHQGHVDWLEYARATASVERERYLNRKLRSRRLDAEELVGLFLGPPLYMSGHARGYGTLYTVAYRSDGGRADFRWPDSGVTQSLDDFEERELVIGFAS